MISKILGQSSYWINYKLIFTRFKQLVQLSHAPASCSYIILLKHLRRKRLNSAFEGETVTLNDIFPSVRIRAPKER